MRAERLGESWADWRCNVSAQEEQQLPLQAAGRAVTLWSDE